MTLEKNLEIFFSSENRSILVATARSKIESALDLAFLFKGTLGKLGMNVQKMARYLIPRKMKNKS